MEEKKQFTVKDLEVGMVLLLLDTDEGETSFAMVLPSKGAEGGLCVSGPETWYPLERLGEDFTYETCNVLAVFDVCKNNREASMISSNGRDLLWTKQV